MRRTITSLMSVGVAVCATALVACSGDSNTAPAASASLNVAITDAPFPFDAVARADIYVVRIDAKIADADSAEAESGKDNDSNSNTDPAKDWVTLATPNAAINLLDLQGGKVANLGQTTLPTGTYQGFRIIIDASKSSITLKNGTTLSGANGGIKFPSAARSGIKIKLDKPISLVANGTQMVIDFDLGKSFVLRGNSLSNNGLLFKPVVRGVARDITGGISGTVHDSTATGAAVNGASVEILKAGSVLTDTVSSDVIATTKSDSTGAYSVQFLLPATYAVRATPPSGSTRHPALVPAVVVASGTTTANTNIVLP